MNTNETAAIYLNNGNQSLEEGNLEEAIAAYRSAIELNPDISWSYHNLGEALAKLGQFEDAIAAFRRAIELKPDFSWSYHHLGDALAQQEDWEESATAFGKAIELNPEHFGTYVGLGKSLAKLGQLDEAIAAYNHAGELNPDADWIHHALANVVQQRNQSSLAEVIASYRQMIELNPDNIEAYQNLLQVQPDNWEAWLQLGNILVQQGKLEDAIAAYRRVIAHNPHNQTAYYSLGECLAKLGQLEEASAAYRQAIELSEQEKQKASTLEPTEDREEVITRYRQAIEDNPDNISEYYKLLELEPDNQEVLLQLAQALLRQGKLDDASVAYRRASELEPEAEWIQHKLGDVLQQRTKVDLEGAIVSYRRAIELNPDGVQAYRNLLEIQPDNVEVWLQLGKTLVKLGQWENAIAAYQKAVELNPDSETLRYELDKVLAEQNLVPEEKITDKVEDSLELGKTLTEQGDFEEALKYYRKACELNPNSFDAPYQLSVCLSQYTESKLTVLESDPDLGKVILQQLKEAHPEIDLSDLNDDAFLQALSEFSDGSFVRELYRAYLMREPEPGATENGSHCIQNTLSRKELINVFRKSLEFSSSLLNIHGPENVEKHIALHWRRQKIFSEYLPEKKARHQRCIELNPYSYDLYLESGQDLDRSGRPNEAILDYYKAIKIGCKLVDEDRIEEAIKCYQKFLQILPEKTEIYYDLALKLARRGKIHQLISCHDKLLKQSDKSFDLHHKMALFLAKENLINEAVTCFHHLSIIQSLNNNKHLYDRIWDDLNNKTLFSTNQTDYPDAISQQDAERYFQNHSRYRVLTLYILTEEQKLYLKQMNLSIDNLGLMAQDDFYLERVYINSFSDSQQELLSNQLRLADPSYQQSLVETGYVYTICPFSGKVLRSNQSFVINHLENPAKQRGHDLQGFCYRFLGKEVFYLMVGWPLGNRLLVYFPKLELIISLDPNLNEGMVQPIESINKLKSNMISYWKQVKSYLSPGIKQVADVIGLGFNLGHYLWQDLTGIDVLRENGILHKLDKIIVGPGDYFSCQDLFPEIPADKFIEVEDVSDVFQKVIENNYVALRVNGIFIKEQLIERIRQTALQKCSIDFLTNLKKVKQHHPVLCVQVRAGGRVWVSQVTGISNIINKLFLDYPNLAVVFDGWSVTGKEDSSSSCWSTISLEKEVMNQIIALINPNIPTHSVIGSTTFETSAWWIEAIDLHISPNGSGLTYGSWIANKPGIVHGPIQTYWTRNLYAESVYRENLRPQVFIPEQHIIDKGDGSYDCNWRVIYDECLKMFKNEANFTSKKTGDPKENMKNHDTNTERGESFFPVSSSLANLTVKKEELIIRYSVLFNPLLNPTQGIQLSTSLFSLKLYLFPYIPCHIVIYTLPEYISSIEVICNFFDIHASSYSFISLTDDADQRFSESIQYASNIDRICIRRMLADFRELPVDQFRLLLGTDCYFFRPPHELLAFAWSSSPNFKVLYAIDAFTFGTSIRYSVPYWQGNVLAGLLGDFYCLAPGVSLSRSSIMGCLQLIDSWPPSGRLHENDSFISHACEQIAAAILLAQFPAKELPESVYRHWEYQSGCALLHGKHPDRFLDQMPPEVARRLAECWEFLGYRDRED